MLRPRTDPNDIASVVVTSQDSWWPMKSGAYIDITLRDEYGWCGNELDSDRIKVEVAATPSNIDAAKGVK